jgi:hypothetical protein
MIDRERPQLPSVWGTWRARAWVGFLSAWCSLMAIAATDLCRAVSHAAKLDLGMWVAGSVQNSESTDSRTVVVVVCGECRLSAGFAIANAGHLWSFWVVWMCFVTIKCPNNHQLNVITGSHSHAGMPHPAHPVLAAADLVAGHPGDLPARRGHGLVEPPA